MADNAGGGAYWERLEDEPPMAYAAFCEYRDEGITRSLRRAAQNFYAQHGDDEGHRTDTEGTPPGAAALRRFKEWSRTWMWRARVEAFDDEEARKRSAEFAKRRLEIREQMYTTGKIQLNAAMLKSNEMQNDFSAIPDRLVPSLTREAIRTLNLALGEPTEHVATSRRPGLPTAEEKAILDELTLEEKEELAYNPTPENMAYFEKRFDEIERRKAKEGGDSTDESG
jgi:hypothetical protein